MPIQAINQNLAHGNKGLILPHNTTTYGLSHQQQQQSKVATSTEPRRNLADAQSPNAKKRQLVDGKRKQLRCQDTPAAAQMELPRSRARVLPFLDAYQPPSQGPSAHESQQSTSAESGKCKTPLLKFEETRFLAQYGRETFADMLQNEYKLQFNALMVNQ